MTMVERRPSGLQRALLRAPVLLYRARLGWLLGRRFLYLAHRGRTSGRRRDTALEVVHYNERAPEAVVVAAWGARSDWYRNITASPPLEVRVGRRRWVCPRHRVLDAPELVAVVQDYWHRHPRGGRPSRRGSGWLGRCRRPRHALPPNGSRPWRSCPQEWRVPGTRSSHDVNPSLAGEGPALPTCAVSKRPRDRRAEIRRWVVIDGACITYWRGDEPPPALNVFDKVPRRSAPSAAQSGERSRPSRGRTGRLITSNEQGWLETIRTARVLAGACRSS